MFDPSEAHRFAQFRHGEMTSQLKGEPSVIARSTLTPHDKAMGCVFWSPIRHEAHVASSPRSNVAYITTTGERGRGGVRGEKNERLIDGDLYCVLDTLCERTFHASTAPGIGEARKIMLRPSRLARSARRLARVTRTSVYTTLWNSAVYTRRILLSLTTKRGPDTWENTLCMREYANKK